MERHRVVVQIVTLMLLIFVMGGWAGWTLARGQAPVSPGPAGSPGRPRQANQDRMLRDFKQQLNLTAEQQAKLEPLLSEWSKAVNAVDQSRLKERRELFRKYTPDIRTHLTPEQQGPYDRMIRRVELYQERRLLP